MFVCKLSQSFDPAAAFSLRGSEEKNTTLQFNAVSGRTRQQMIAEVLASEADVYFSPVDGELYAVSSSEPVAPFEKVLETKLDNNITIGGVTASEKFVWGAAGVAIGALVLR